MMNPMGARHTSTLIRYQRERTYYPSKLFIVRCVQLYNYSCAEVCVLLVTCSWNLRKYLEFD